MALDVDGVLTDGVIAISGGDETKFFDVRDGLGISVARSAGIQFAFITGRHSEIVAKRAAELKIEHVIQGCDGKAAGLRAACAELGVPLDETAFVGDDWNDLPALTIAGLAVAPADGAKAVRGKAHIVTEARGGHGAVREFLEWLLETHGGWDHAARAWVDALNTGEAETRQ